jgi:2-(1,2-epoxy-1,2-dihydrophenyl)acetyl-CoA isomerase
METLTLDVRDGVAWCTLDGPALNALDTTMFQALLDTAEGLRERNDVRVAVITGAGRAFCSGQNLKTFTEEVDVSNPNDVRRYLRFVGRVVMAWMQLDIPTIAAVNGLAVGGGANLALMCDLVVMREDAVISEIYAQRGFVLDMGASWLLTRRVGLTRAAELALLGETITADDAARIGLVNRAVPIDEFDGYVEDLAGRLAASPTAGLAMIKSQLRHAHLMDLEAALEQEAYAMSMAFATEDVAEAMAAFREGREPEFRGR